MGGGEQNARARVLLVDDHAYMRVAMRAILGTDGTLEVVGEAEDGLKGVERCRELHPDVVLMDMDMPVMGGIEATERIKAEFPLTSVLVLTAHADHGLLMRAVKAGAAGYVLKAANPKDALVAVKAALSGETPLDQGLAMRLLRHLGEEAADQRAPAPPRAEQGAWGPVAAVPNPLTPRETEVLVCLASGKTNRQIAMELHLSLSTVKRHLEHILPKLKVSDRTQAALKALEMGLLPPAEQGEGTTT